MASTLVIGRCDNYRQDGDSKDSTVETSLPNLTQSVLEEFQRRQQDVIHCFFPIRGAKFNQMLPRAITKREELFLTRIFASRGYNMVWESDREFTSMTLDSTLKLEKLGDENRHLAICLMSPGEWNRKMEHHASEWLFGCLNSRAQTCNEEQKEPEEGEIFIPLYYDARFEFNSDSKLEQRRQLFSKPLKWVNAISRYRVELIGYSRLRVRVKPPKAIEEAKDRCGALIFASLACVNRIQDPAKLDWRLTPGPAMRLVVQFLTGLDILQLNVGELPDVS